LGVSNFFMFFEKLYLASHHNIGVYYELLINLNFDNIIYFGCVFTRHSQDKKF
jgi:hypothetical protein